MRSRSRSPPTVIWWESRIEPDHDRGPEVAAAGELVIRDPSVSGPESSQDQIAGHAERHAQRAEGDCSDGGQP